MSGVSWSFQGGRDRDVAAFIERVTECNDELGNGAWQPAQLVISAPEIRVAYHVDQKPKTIRATSPRGFTMADVLHQIHKLYARELADADQAFFEGLELDDEGPPPLYHVKLGS